MLLLLLPGFVVLVASDLRGRSSVVGSRDDHSRSGGSFLRRGGFLSGYGSVQLRLRLDAGRLLVQRRLRVGQRLAVQAGVHGVQGVHVTLGTDGVLHGVRLRPRYVPHEVRVPEVPPSLQRGVHLRERPPPRRGPLDVRGGQRVEGSVFGLGEGPRSALDGVVRDLHPVHAVRGSEGVCDPLGAETATGDVVHVERMVERGGLVPSASVPRLPAGVCPLSSTRVMHSR